MASTKLPLKSETSLSVNSASSRRNFSSAAIAAVISIFAIASSNACTVSDFEIIQADWRFSNETKDMIVVVGEIKSNCSAPDGVEVQAVFRDGTGKVVETRQFYPRGSRNMNPDETYAFKDIFLTDRATQTIATGSVKVIGTHFWRAER